MAIVEGAVVGEAISIFYFFFQEGLGIIQLSLVVSVTILSKTFASFLALRDAFRASDFSRCSRSAISISDVPTVVSVSSLLSFAFVRNHEGSISSTLRWH